MKFKVKIIETQSSREIEFLRSNLKKSILSKFEIWIIKKEKPKAEGNSFFTNDRREAIRIKNLIDKSRNFRGKIYHKVHGIFLPYPLHDKRTKKYIDEILHLTALSTENNKGGKC